MAAKTTPQASPTPPLRLCPPTSRELPLPAAYPSLQGGRQATRKEAGGQELGRGVSESSCGETLKQEQMGSTEQRTQNQDMLQIEEWEGSAFRNRQKYLFVKDFSCHTYSPKTPLSGSTTSCTSASYLQSQKTAEAPGRGPT